MPDTVADVLLISADPQFCELVDQHRPPAVRLRCLTAQELALSEPTHAGQVWVDLDTCAGVNLPDASRRIYFYSRQDTPSESLPAGLFVRKPCTAVVFQVLWAAVGQGHALTPRAIEHQANLPLPSWLLDFQELRLSTLCRKLVSALGPRLGYRDVSLYLHDFERGALTLAETTHSRSIELAVPIDATGEHLMVAVARDGRIFRTERTPDELAARGIPRLLPRSYDDDACLVTPLCSEGEVWGVLNFSGRAPTPLTEADPPLDNIFAFLGRALHHARVYDRARIEARVDGLTGLYNQRWITESLEKEIRRAERFGTPLAVLMVDLDGLKTVNDHLGHAAGDCVLRHAASRITRVLRQFDGAARVGGDEFVVMLPGTNLKGAQHVARRLLHSIRTDPAQFRDVALPTTLSIGAAEWRTGWNAARLIEAADQAMYNTKQNGGSGLTCLEHDCSSAPERDPLQQASADTPRTPPPQ